MQAADRLLTCGYCKVRLYVIGSDPPKFCLPVKPAPVGEIVMVPYWRVRARRYRLIPSGVRASAADCTALACEAPRIASSLGVRAQAVPLRFASPVSEGRFLPVTRAADSVFERLARLSRVEQAITGTGAGGDEDDGAAAPFEATLATATSLVYTPVRVARSVFDAVLNRRIAGIDGDAWRQAVGGADDRPAPVRFVPTLCPECGWQLEGGADSLVMSCVNCGRGWKAGDGRLVPAPFDALPAVGWTPDAHLPFWRAEASIATTWADLVRLANLPRVMQPAWDREPLGFWFPAFDANPEQFLRLAQEMTCARPERPQPGTPGAGAATPVLPRNCRAVTLPERSLDEALVVLLTTLARTRRGIHDLLREADLRVRSSRLVYVPVRLQGREYLNPDLALTVPAFGFQSSF
jgi:hypothetical protein